jgi:hypothetical protein
MNKLRLLGAVSGCLICLVPLLAHAVADSGQGTWDTTLQARDLDGNSSTIEAYYDTNLNITWLADANYTGTAMDWTTTNSWAAGLYGNTGWRLPTLTDTGTSGCDFAYTGTDCGYNVDTANSEMAHMFYITLGNKALYDASGVSPQNGSGLTNTGPFSNLLYSAGSVISVRWSATEFFAPSSGSAWVFVFGSGYQNGNIGTDEFYA